MPPSFNLVTASNGNGTSTTTTATTVNNTANANTKQNPQNPLALHEKSRPPLPSGNTHYAYTSNSSLQCDKSVATTSTAELSYTSLSNSTSSFGRYGQSSPSSSSSLSRENSNSPTSSRRKPKSMRPLHAPVTLHSQSSLLDMTMDESHDDEASIDHNLNNSINSNSSISLNITPQKNKSMRSFTDKSNRNEVTADSTLADSSDYDLGSSIMEQTEKNLAAISESMSGSFCAQGDINNSCTMPDCGNLRQPSGNNNVLFSDRLVQNRLLDDFNYLLGSNVMPCCEEKTFFSSCFGTLSPDDNIEEDVNKIRNRAGESWRARAYRIRRLREERMLKGDSFEYSLSNRRQVSLERVIGKSHSAEGRMDHFLSEKTPSDNQLHSSSNWQRGSMRPKHEVHSDPLGRIIGDCIDPISPVKEDAVELEVVWKQQDDLCYDSDPGETSFRKSLVSKKKLKKPNVPSKNMARSKSLSLCEKVEAGRMGNMRRRRNPISSLDRKYEGEGEYDEEDDDSLGENESFQIHVSFEHDSDDDDDDDESSCDGFAGKNYRDENPWHGGRPRFHQLGKKTVQEDLGIAQNVQNALNRTWTLTWHPVHQKISQEKKSKINLLKTLGTYTSIAPNTTLQSPRCIRLWFERGNRIRGNNIVEPKLMWRDAYQPELSSRRKLNDSITSGPNQICLLSICRILEVQDQIDRAMYPFAKKTCSFLIRTCDDEEFLFETQSEKERDELVYMWKLVVARLASQAVVGDGDKMVGEFFVPSSFGVP